MQVERQKEEDNKKMIEMQLSNDNAVKLMVTDQRNMMQSGQNYMKHPQIEDLWSILTILLLTIHLNSGTVRLNGKSLRAYYSLYF